MSVLKRSWLYITRKKMKSLIMLFILFGIATAVLSGISIKKAATAAREETSKGISKSFQIYGEIPEELVKKVNEVDGISKYDAAIMSGEVRLKGMKLLEPTKNMVDYFDDTYKEIVLINGHDYTEADSKFISKAFKLIEGRHIVKEDKNKVLIHKDLAELNNLKVGDTIVANKFINESSINEYYPVASKDAPDSYNLEIVGIFDTDNTERLGSSLEFSENLLLCDNYTIKTLYGYSDGAVNYEKVTFYADEDANLDEVISRVEKLPFDWNNYPIEKSESTFKTLSNSFDALENIINMLLIGAVIIGVVILSLVLAFWIQGRIHETGILLSIGVPKMKIISQYIVELLLISFIAFGASFFSGRLIAQNIGNAMVEQASKQSVQEFNSQLGGFNLGLDSETQLITRTVDEIDVNVELQEMIYVYIVGTIIIILSVIVSSASIIRLKPKEILSKMS